MKTIKLKTATVEEIIIRPNEAIPITVSYKLFDDTGEYITTKRINIEKSEATSQINNIASKLLDKVTEKEGL